MEFAEVVIPALLANFEVTMHAITNVHMDVSGDTAAGECYVIAYHKFRGDRAKAEGIFGSRYAAQLRLARCCSYAAAILLRRSLPRPVRAARERVADPAAHGGDGLERHAAQRRNP